MHRGAWPDVRIACVWIAQLPLRVEVLRHAAWDGRPLVLGGAPGERKIVQLCSPEAEAAGVRPGLPLREIVPLCPDAIVLQPDPVRTAAVLEAVLADLPVSAVQAEFGPPAARAWRLAHGKDDEPVIARPISTSIQDGLRFDDPLGSVEAVMAAIDQLLAHTFSQSALSGRSVRQVRLRALLSDSTSWERQYTFKEALSTRDAARRALKSKLDLPNGLPPAPIEELALELLGLTGEAARQTGLFVARARQLAEIAEAARQLRARYGLVPLYHAIEVEPWSRIPERRWALVQVPCDL